MKLKGEKELLAEEVYEHAELQFQELVLSAYKYLGNVTEKLDASYCESFNSLLEYYKTIWDETMTDLEKSLSINNAIDIANRLLRSIQSGDFSLCEIRGLHRALVDNKDGFVKLLIITIDSGQYVLKLLAYFDIHDNNRLGGNSCV